MRRGGDFHPEKDLLALAGARPRIAVAFSGGVDSTALAHALVRARRRFAGLRLLHVDHGLQGASADWARHCARMARVWRVPLVALEASIDRKRGESPEAVARDARYAQLARAMEAGEVLVTAQHRDDQAETLLLQLFRGAGVAGLAAMPAIAAFGPGKIARPLLDTSRAQLLHYAHTHHLRWVDDPSNEQTVFGRNFLRHRVLPAIRERWPGVDQAIARSAAHMADAQRLLDAQATADLAAAADGAGLKVTALRALPAARRRLLVRAFVMRAGLEPPQTNWLREILGPMLAASADAQPVLELPGAKIRRRAGRLELEVISQVRSGRRVENVSKSWRWEQQRELVVNEAGDSLELVDDAAGPIDLARLPKTLKLRARIGGESLRPSTRRQSLKKLLQSARIPVEDRARMPLLFIGDRLIAAGDRWIDASIAATVKSRRRARLKWTPAR
ncbi:MAG TPA: tRNA lysidine(34) synthetase TilS [Steroidobacteraceae bacterium]|jgi:tRNA(Ile)-lysidine synthase|nr:tRNA lysidine(34) synthetase TilS [Steroidobacteraceae bacterium]